MTDGRFGAMQFHAEPAVGILEAGAAADITLSFCPESQHRYTATASCAVQQRKCNTASCAASALACWLPHQ